MTKQAKLPISFRVDKSTIDLLDRIEAVVKLLAEKTPEWINIPRSRSELAAFLLRKSVMAFESDLFALDEYWRGGEMRIMDGLLITLASEIKDAGVAQKLLPILLQFDEDNKQ